MLNGWKKVETEQKHEETSHSKPIQKSESDHRIQIILIFELILVFFLGFWGRIIQLLFIFKIIQEMN